MCAVRDGFLRGTDIAGSAIFFVSFLEMISVVKVAVGVRIRYFQFYYDVITIIFV